MGSGASSDVKELQRIFDACDLESCGSLTGEDLKIALAGVGLAKDAAKTVDFPAFCELVKEAMVSSPDPPRIVPFALRGMRFEQLQAICEVCGCGQDGWLLAQCQSAMESESGTRRLKEDLYSLNRFLVRPATAGPEDVRLPESCLELADKNTERLEMGVYEAPSASDLATITSRLALPRPKRSCCFAELVNPAGLQCDYFVSHSWGHPFVSSVATLSNFLKGADGSHSTAFWICLFALNQHRLQEELGTSSVRAMPFAYGLAKASQGVLMILDQKVEPFRRLWCLYEAQRAWELHRPLQLLLDGETDGGSGPSLALLVAEELQKLSAFDASASVAGDKIKIWHQVINRSVQRAFPMASFEAQFDGSHCRIRGFGPSWFSHFDSKVSQLLASPVFRFCLDAGDGPLALRYLGLGAEASRQELRCCEKLLPKSLQEVWVSNPSCGECRLLHVYAHLGDLQNLDFLLAARADPTERAKDPKQRAALHFAVKAGHDECAKRLLEGKALAHDPDKNRETPLQIAAYGGFTSLVQLLLRAGAVVNAADRDGWTALICAARAGHGETVELLLLNKASPHAMDSLGRNAFRHAKMAGYDLPQLEKCSEMLEEDDLECQMVDR